MTHNELKLLRFKVLKNRLTLRQEVLNIIKTYLSDLDKKELVINLESINNSNHKITYTKDLEFAVNRFKLDSSSDLTVYVTINNSTPYRLEEWQLDTNILFELLDIIFEFIVK